MAVKDSSKMKDATFNDMVKSRRYGMKKNISNDEMMDIFVGHAKFDGGYDFDRTSSHIECRLRDGFTNNGDVWHDARLYMDLVGTDYYRMGVDFDGQDYQTQEVLFDQGNGETIGDTMSELLGYAQMHAQSQQRW